ncbi:Pentatricopeptide repeat-containing protein [Raphanus sativus]|uniref:Pentatricopeptide repeat-containing protein At2g17525, mitochondrial n=1 Tax=Raphanus sativus TaxID=3726 RepID=A0A6J0K2Y2_RAPSA|nr:pentatricopeptide repeat-containing protein At2g17525, mitochondrial [Raphanus sativus]KAJ4889105.1 Pentatricopeptide repeat-containing protein [Raphanus sativus]
MLRISNISTSPRYVPVTTRLRLQLRSLCSSSSSSSLSVPSDDHIIRLILDQKSPSGALQTFQWASTFPGFTHSPSTYRALFHKLCSFRRFETVYQLLDEMPQSIGSPPDDAIFITIVRGLGRAKLTKRVISVLDLVSKFGIKPSVKVFNSILDVLVKEDIEIAREFFRRKMMASGVQGDEYTYGILMKGLCLTNRIGDGFKLLQFMKTRGGGGVAPNAVVYNTLLHALCKNGKVGRARSLMSEMKEPNDVTFNILISAYCNEKKLVQSMVLLEKCFCLGFVPDVVTVTKVMEVLCSEGRVSEALEVLERVEGKGSKVDVVACNTLVKGYCALGKVRVAQRFFKEMERKGYLPNVETYNLLIGGFCEAGMLDSALDTFNDMKTDAVRRNFATFNTLVKGLSVGGRVDDGLKILELMEESENVRGGRVDPYNSVIYGFYKEKRWEEALEFLLKMENLFPRAVERSFKLISLCEKGSVDDVKSAYDQMIGEGGVPNVVVSHCLVHRFSQEGYMEETLELINDMVTGGYLPQSSTFNAVILGFCKQDRVMNGIKFVEDMAERGCVPDGESYNPLLGELCVKGDFQMAWLTFSRMMEKSIAPDSSTWSSLMYCLNQKTAFHIDIETLLQDIIKT